MPIKSCPKAIKYITTVIFLLGVPSFLFSQEPSSKSGNRGYIEGSSVPEAKKGTVISGEKENTSKPVQASLKEEKSLSELQKQARLYRNRGWDLQNIGNLEGAVNFYQKAIELDPAYAVAYNDLGVIYEAGGAIDRAEDSYLKAVKIDPNYLSPYTNLALLYENKRDLDKAAFYWKKRADLGLSADPWTQKASGRFKDIIAVQKGESFAAGSREQEVIGLTKDVIRQKAVEGEDNRELAKVHFQKAKLSYQKQDEVTALQEAVNAQLLDPSNKEIEKFIEKVQHRLLSR